MEKNLPGVIVEGQGNDNLTSFFLTNRRGSHAISPNGTTAENQAYVPTGPALIGLRLRQILTSPASDFSGAIFLRARQGYSYMLSVHWLAKRTVESGFRSQIPSLPALTPQPKGCQQS